MENELEFGKGGVREDIPDPRDYKWGMDIGSAAFPFDWTKGYDVEAEVSQALGTPFKLPVKNQNGSSSCGGQAWAYYGQVLDTLNDKATQEKSAKFIYSQTFVGIGGSAGRDNCAVCINQGWGNESDCPSYESNLPPSELFMQKVGDITQTARDNAKRDKALAYANVIDRDLDNIATAVRDNHGCIFGVAGTNNGTWRTAYPVPPTTFNNSWNHWLYCGKVKEMNGKKYFGVLNSWGEDVGEKGWQWLSEDYIKTFIIGYPAIWSIWTMVSKSDVVVAPYFVFTKNLRYGMTDPDVKELQKRLGVVLTSYFGTLTLAAMKKFQFNNGLYADGICGPLTRGKLNQ